MPFKSQKQRRWMWVNKPEMAAEWEKKEKDKPAPKSNGKKRKPVKKNGSR